MLERLKRKLNVNKKINSIFLIALFLLTGFMSVGYSALSQNLMISGDVDYYVNSNKLYNVLKRAADVGIYAKEYTGTHQDSMTGVGDKKIYYWYGSNTTNGTAIQNMNNVIFAGQCWQMIRTTDTGGVKMIYNGEPENNQCLNTRGTHVGYASRTSQNLNGNYWYGTSYTYDSTNQIFSIAGILEQKTWNATNGPDLIGKYTCKSTSSDGTCATLYLVESYYSTSSAYVIPLNSNSTYAQFGTTQYNSATTLAHVGYMYKTSYANKSVNLNTFGGLLQEAEPILETEYNLVSNDATYPFTFDSTTKQWTSTMQQDSKSASIVFKITTDDDYVINYDISSEANYDKVFVYKNGTELKNDSGIKSGSVILNGLTTTDQIEVKYQKDGSVAKGTDSVSFSIGTPTGDLIDNRYKFSNSVVYTNGNYELINAISAESNDNLSSNHYTCLSTSTTCTKVNYIYYKSTTSINYIELENGKTVANAIDEMLFPNDVNTTSSTIKNGIEAWYKKYLIDYDAYIEDTIFCNNRSIKSLGGWNPDSEVLNTYLLFQENDNRTDLSCTNIIDKFSTLNNKAQLTYKVGLMSSPEMNLLNNNGARNTGSTYYLISPNNSSSSIKTITNTGSISNSGVNSSSTGVRPAISLVPDIEFISGDGSMANPYVVDAESTQVNPDAPTISGSATRVYGSSTTTLTCSTPTTYENGMNVYYSFGYATTDGGTPSNWTTASTTNTLTISPTEYIGQRWYSCRIYATDGASITNTINSLPAGDAEVTINNATITFNTNINNGTLSGTSPLYVKVGDSNVYTEIRGTTVGTVPTATKEGYTFTGWYTASTNGNKVLNADGTFTGTAVEGYTATNNWTSTENKTLYAQFAINNPEHPRISGGDTKIYNYQDTTLTCTNTTSYATGTSVYYEFGYATSTTNFTNGTITWLGNASTTNTLLIGKTAFRTVRYYTCRVYASDDSNTTEAVAGTSYTTMGLVNARLYFNATENGGTTTTQNLYVPYGQSNIYTERTNTTAGTIPTATKVGYTFAGWYTASSGGNQVIDALGVVQASVSGWTNASKQWLRTSATNNTTDNALYAQFGANSYTIGYTMNGGVSGGNAPTTDVYDANIEISKPSKTFTVNIDANSQNATITQDGIAVTSASSEQTFAGWTASNLNTSTAFYGPTSDAVTMTWTNGNTPIGADYNSVFFKNLVTEGTVTLIANWTTADVSLPKIEKEGYICGYATSTSGSIAYASEGSYTPSTTAGSKTLYAKCVINQPAPPTISGGETKIYGASATTLTCATTTSYASGANLYYSFGYATTDGGEPSNWTTASTTATTSISATAYVGQRWYSCRVYASDGESISETTTSLRTEDTEMTINNAKLTFNATSNGGTLSGSGTLYVKKGGTVVYTGIRNTTTGTIPIATKTGYTFNGWYSAASGGSKVLNADGTFTGTAVSGYTTATAWNATANKTLYAQYSGISYTIGYTMNGGVKGTNGPTSGTYDENVTINKPSKTFTLNFDANSQGASITKAGNTVTEIEQAQVFDGWTASNLDTSNAKYGTSETTVTTSWSNGATKVGASDDPMYFKNLRSTNGEVTLTANWTTEDIVLPSVSKTGYTCNFNTESNGSGTTYEGGANYTPSTTAGSSTLYVRCSINDPNTPTITGGTTKIYGASATTLTCATTATYAEGTSIYYSFGYATSDGGSPSNWTTATTTATYSVSATAYVGQRWYSCRVYASDGENTSETMTSSAANDTLMTINNATITFDATTNGGTLSGTSPLYAKQGVASIYTTIRGTTVGTIPTATKTGYTFAGWYSAASGGSKVLNADGTFTGTAVTGYTTATAWNATTNKTLYAQYTIDDPVTPTITGGTTKIYGASATTLTCATTSTYASGTSLYYSFGYATSDGGSPSNWTTATTTATLSISATEYVGQRWYSCRVYASDGTATSGTVASLTSTDTAMTINNATITFDAETSGGTLSGTSPLYAKQGVASIYTTIRGTTAGIIPTATKEGYTFDGWYTAAVDGSKVLNADGTFTGTAVSGYTTATSWNTTANKTLYAQFTITDPATPTITGGATKIYGASATTLTCATTATYAEGTRIYYSFGYATSDGGSPSNWTTATTTATTSISATAYVGQRWYSCRVYASDGENTSETMTSSAANDTLMTINNATITFDATTNGGTLSGTSPLYAKQGVASIYTTIRGTTVGTIPTATKTGYIFDGWYTAASGGSKVLNADGTFTGTAVSGYTTATAWNATANKNLYAKFTIDDPETPTISGGTTRIYNYADRDLTCTTTSTYAEGTSIYYEFGYATSTANFTSGTITWLGNPSTTATYTVTKALYLGSRYYTCRVYAGDGSLTSGTVQTASTTTMSIVNARLYFDAATNGGTVGTANLYVPYSQTNIYTGRTNTTAGTIPTATKDGYTFNGWYTAASGGTQVIDASGVVQASVSSWTNASKQWLRTATGNNDTSNVLYAQYTINDPATPTISGGATKVYNYQATTLTCATTTSYAEGTNIYYEFGYATSTTNFTNGTITWLGTPSTTATYSVSKTAFRTTRYYTCRVYASDGTETSGTVQTASTTTMALVNARLYFNATTNGGTLSGSANLYVPYGATNIYTTRTGTTAGTIPTATKTGYTFAGWYTAASGGTQVINASGAVQASVSSWTNASKQWLRTASGNNDTSNVLYAQYTINDPETPTISGGATKVYNYQATTLTCATTTSYASGTNVYYEFGYATSTANFTSGTITWLGTPSTTATLSIAKTAFRTTRYYTCRVYASDGTATSGVVQTASTTTMALVNARLYFNATTNGGTLSGSANLYVPYGATNIYTTRTGTTAGTIPTATQTGYDFDGWYTAASGGTQVINASGTVQASVSGWTNASKQWLRTAAGNNNTSNVLYAQFHQSSCNDFANESWETIISCAQAGNTSSYTIGATKSITLSGIGTFTVRLANTTTNCTSLASQTACGFVIEFADVIAKKQMYTSSSNSGGYPGSLVYSYLNSTVYNAMPSTVKAAIINTTVVSGYESGKSSNYTTTNKLYLLSGVEIQGWANGYDKVTTDYTRQLDYYAEYYETAKAIKYYNGSATAWWLRSASATDTIDICSVESAGYPYHVNAINSIGVSPAFRIG